ncbi:hypothetical protein EHW67_19250 [Arenibacter aquaticus]|uniref:DUF3347 domain-containing protein n=1 Tax=Arenibacter aquaticus TaxID=2489054 RepID=A0A3S0CL79_9FLAO|nr:hypothetical protein [Arenibacter aquaticus]RTE52317.1 hypothetical protein EHW67_19250 [Arenibacter aquaticus]
MKIITTAITSMLLLLTCSLAQGQDDGIFGAIMEAAAAHDNARHQAQSEANDEAESEAAAEWKEAWEKEMNENGEVMDALDTKYLKCTAMMVLYVHTYLQLVNEHQLADIRMSACDAYGMQALAMASSTTIMYCPEEMAQLSDEELKSIGDDFWAALDQFTVEHGPWLDNEYHPIMTKLQYIINNFFNGVQEQDAGDLSVFSGSPDTPVHVIKYMIEFFRPRYIIPQTLKIAEEMEALGCSG